jgi:hypothetical protein
MARKEMEPMVPTSEKSPSSCDLVLVFPNPFVNSEQSGLTKIFAETYDKEEVAKYFLRIFKASTSGSAEEDAEPGEDEEPYLLQLRGELASFQDSMEGVIPFERFAEFVISKVLWVL